ncbi:MAG: Sec-independent protein translocase subunit TatA/TatB [Methanosarcinaceae archaeon]
MLNLTGILAIFGLPGGYEVVIILLAILLLFGGKKIPELAQGLGKGIKEFKKATNEELEDSKAESEEDK